MVSISAAAIVAIAYLILLVGSLTLFSIYYRNRKALQSKNLDPWFPTHHERDIYLTLLHFEDPPIPSSLLRAALFNRAQEDIRRIYILRRAKPMATSLIANGSLGDATLKALNTAEQELNAEIQDVMAEARGLGDEEWGRMILPQANEAYQRTVMVEVIEWAKKYAAIQDERAKERKYGKKDSVGKKTRQEMLQELIRDNLQDAGKGITGNTLYEMEIE